MFIQLCWRQINLTIRRQICKTQGALAEHQVQALARQLCTILSYLHELSPPVVHRDFTPDNLLLNSDG